jgi:hypothetical protein
MNKNKTIHTLQEALRIFWLENTGKADPKLSERDLELILAADNATFDMSEEKKQQLINRLYDTVTGPSLGTLLTSELKEKNISKEEIALQTDIPVAVLADLKEDKLYPNSIPMLAMKDLLKVLDIPFQKAKSAILKTYELIKLNVSTAGKQFEGQVSFRKSNDEHTSNIKASRQHGAGLFENRNSLEKYLLMLEEEMNE